MSMPSILVEVERHCHIDVDYVDGILMVDRILDKGAIIIRDEKQRYNTWRTQLASDD